MKIITITLAIILFSSAILPVLSQEVFAHQSNLDKYSVDTHYDPVTNDVTFEWDFGNNPHREKCVGYRTTILFGVMVSLNGHEQSSTNWNSLGTDLVLTKINDSESFSVEINCKGKIIVNSNDFNNLFLLGPNAQVTKFFDGEQYHVWMKIAEVIKPQYLSQYSDQLKNTNIHQLGESLFLYFKNGTIPIIDCGESEFPNGTDLAYDSNGSTKTFIVNSQCVETIEQTTPPQTTPKIIPSSPTTDDKNKKNGDCGARCLPSTLGIDSNFKRVVDNGFCYNGECVQVDKWYTAFPIINATVGETNLVETKAYDPWGINDMNMVQFCLGAAQRGEPLEYCEVLIEVYLKTNGTIEYLGIDRIKIIDQDNLIENETVKAYASVVDCHDHAGSLECAKVDLEYSYREAPINHMLVVQLVDKERNTQNFHFNEGVNVLGDSLNKQPTLINDGIEYTRTDKVNDIWQSEEIQYKRLSNTLFERITPYPDYVCNDMPLDEIMNGGTRNNCNFREQMDWLWQN